MASNREKENLYLNIHGLIGIILDTMIHLGAGGCFPLQIDEEGCCYLFQIERVETGRGEKYAI